MRRSIIILAFACLSGAATASDDARCTQEFLASAHYHVGAIDGQLGKRSLAAADLLKYFNPQFKLPDLSDETAASWCQFARSAEGVELIAQRSVISTADLRNDPGPKRLWTAYDNAADCNGVRGEPELLNLRSKNIKPFGETEARAMTSIFPDTLGNPQCRPPGSRPAAIVPPPVIDVESDGIYSPGVPAINRVNEVLREFAVGYRFDHNERMRKAVVDILVTWANANAFSKGIRQPNDKLAIEFDWLEVLPQFVVAFSGVGPTMSLEDRVRVGQWLRRLVGEVQYAAWGAQRQDNKNYLRNYVSLLWGILNDDKPLREAAIEEFKNAIYDMRTDGSFPRDASRGGNGLHYTHRSTMMLVAIATVAKLINIDLFGYESNGRTLHTVINWVALTAKFPDLNARHATACPTGSFKSASVTRPDMQHTLPEAVGVGSIYAWAPVYLASSSARPEVAERLRQSLPALRYAVVSEPTLGGYFSCFAAGIEPPAQTP